MCNFLRALPWEVVIFAVHVHKHSVIFRAASALRQLVQARVGDAGQPPASWLDQAGYPAQPAVRDTGNVYFGHLPNMLWRVLATFRQ